MDTQLPKTRRTRRRPRREATEDRGPKKVRMTLDRATLERLDAHALGTRMDRSGVVAALVQAHCRRFWLVERGSDPAEAANPGGATGEECSQAVAE